MKKTVVILSVSALVIAGLVLVGKVKESDSAAAPIKLYLRDPGGGGA